MSQTDRTLTKHLWILRKSFPGLLAAAGMFHFACANSDTVNTTQGEGGRSTTTTGDGGRAGGLTVGTGGAPQTTTSDTTTGSGASGQGGAGGTGGQGGQGGMCIAEVCDGMDNDCDGTADNGDPGGGEGCTTPLLGVCAVGTTKCDGVNGIVCNANINPNDQMESCNGLDDNCDGVIDDGDPGGGAACMAVGFGICKMGTEHCENGAIKCKPGAPMPEVCDGVDNNCDGNTDEGNPGGGMQCMSGLQGLCAAGVTTCDGVNGVICQPAVAPGMLPEACNGLDDDCDGLTDDSILQVGQNCVAPGFVGICQFGTYSCPTVPPYQLTCDHPLPGTIPETCNAQDDDCNGTIDDPAVLNNLPCSSGLPGACAAGKTLCSGGSQTCTPNVAPGSQTEICNSVDDNCNGMTDEMNPNPACASQNPGASFVQAWACTSGSCQIQTCQSGHANINMAQADGCECSTDSYANTCSVAGSFSVPDNGTVNVTGKIESAAGSDWFTFNFTVPGVGVGYHPKVELTDSAGGQYAMDVMVNCAGGAAGCSTTGGANNESGIQVNVWEQNYNGYVAGAGCCSDNTARVGTVRVRVYRKFGDQPTCSPYTVQATNL